MDQNEHDHGALRRPATARGCVFTVAEARACGWSPGKIRYEVTTGAWCRLRRGVFAEAVVVERASSTRVEQHRLHTAAAVAATGGTWASHESAAAVLGLERLRWPALDRVQLTRPKRGPGRPGLGVCVRVGIPRRAHPARTAAGGPTMARWTTGPAVRVDFLWSPQRTVGEADGLGKYAKYGPGNRLDPLQSEKLRQELLEEWGLEVVRWGFREMRREPDAVAHRVRRGYARSAFRQEIRARNGELARTAARGRALGPTAVCLRVGSGADRPMATRSGPGCFAHWRVVLTGFKTCFTTCH